MDIGFSSTIMGSQSKQCQTESITLEMLAYILGALYVSLLLLNAYNATQNVKEKYSPKPKTKAKAKAAVTSNAGADTTSNTTLNMPTTPNVAGHELVPSREATPEPSTPDSVTVDIDVEGDAQDVRTGNVTEPALEIDGDEVAEMEEENEWESMSAVKKLWKIGLDMWRHKGVYTSPVSHLSDTVSDWTTVLEFYLTARLTDPEDCNGLDMWQFFYISVGSLVLYRVIAAIFVYRISSKVTGKPSWLSVGLQILDLELIPMMIRAHRLGLSEGSNPQELLGMFEAVFEGAIQAVIQFVYLLYVPGSGSPSVWVSAVWSLYHLCHSIAKNDLWAVKASSRSVSAAFYLFRFMDISCRLAFYVVFWVAGSSLTTFCYALSNFVFGLAIYLWQSILEKKDEKTISGAQTEMLMLPMSSPMFFGKYGVFNEKHKIRQWKAVFGYLAIEAVVTFFLLWFNTEINEQSDVVMWIARAATLGSFIRCLLLFMWRWDKRSSWDESKERGSYSDLLTQHQWQSALENILFSASIHDTASMSFKAVNQYKYSLFQIACGIGNESLLRKVWEETPPSMRIESLKSWHNMLRVLKQGGDDKSTESKLEQLHYLLEEEWDWISACDWELNETNIRTQPESVKEYWDLIKTETCEDFY